MEKQTIIGLISIVVICGTVSYSLLNIYALEQLELSGIDKNFRLFVMSTDDKIKICNNLPIPASFNQFNINIYFEKELLGTFKIDSTNIMPTSYVEAEGKYVSESMAQSQSLFMHFDHLFSQSDTTVRIDPRKMDITTEFQTTVIGIPYTISKQYTSFDFWNMLNDKNNLNC